MIEMLNNTKSMLDDKELNDNLQWNMYMYLLFNLVFSIKFILLIK